MTKADGSVARADALKVLSSVKCDGVSIGVDGNAVRFIKDGIPEVIILPTNVPRRMLQRFDKKYGVKIECFYHPEMCGEVTRH